MALAGSNAHSWLRPEVDELSSEITLVLGHVLIKRGRQPRIVPSCCLGVMIHKVDPGSVCQAHFPTAGKRTELRHRLLLNGVSISIVAVHSNVLLTTWINPSSGTSIVINEVGSAFRRVSLFPTSGKLSGARSSSA